MAQVRKGQAPDRLSRVARAVPQVTAALRGGELDDRGTPFASTEVAEVASTWRWASVAAREGVLLLCCTAAKCGRKVP